MIIFSTKYEFFLPPYGQAKITFSYSILMKILIHILLCHYFVTRKISLQYSIPKIITELQTTFKVSKEHVLIKFLFRGFSYGGELAQLGGLAHLGEISPSLRNYHKNMLCSFKK